MDKNDSGRAERFRIFDLNNTDCRYSQMERMIRDLTSEVIFNSGCFNFGLFFINKS